VDALEAELVQTPERLAVDKRQLDLLEPTGKTRGEKGVSCLSGRARSTCNGWTEPFARKDGADARRLGNQIERYREDPACESPERQHRVAKRESGTADVLKRRKLDPRERQDVVCDPLLRLPR
jgi:hypothetical protein